MKRTLSSVTFAACLLLAAALSDPFESFAQKKPAASKPKTPAPAAKPKTAAANPADDDALKAELDEIVKLDAATRVERLTAFLKAIINLSWGTIGNASCKARAGRDER